MSDFFASATFVSNDPIFWVIAVITMLIAGISKGGFGGAFVLICIPLLSLQISPVIAVALLLPMLCMMDLAGLVTFWGKWHLPTIKVLIPGSLVGIGIGTWVFTSLSVDGVKLIIGTVAVLFTLHHWSKYWFKKSTAANERRPGKIYGFVCSTVAGFTSHVAHAGFPPYSMYMLPQRLPKEQLVATTVVMFAVINYVKLVPYSLTGQFTPQVLWSCLVLSPLAPIGVVIGKFLLKRVNEVWFYRGAYIFVFVAGLKLLVDGSGLGSGY